MNQNIIYKIKQSVLITFSVFIFNQLHAQTDADGVMMAKNNFCTGVVYNYSSWKNYWEGTFKRDNANLGTVSTQMIGLSGNYGVSDKLNLLFGIPYVQTKASAGTLKGMKGIQDLSLMVKWMPLEVSIGKGDFSVYGIAGISFPLTNYVADYLPLSIGLRSKNILGRIMADYQIGSFFATASATYIFRDNISIDRTSYYTTEMHYSNEVKMPDAFSENFRIGYRSHSLIAEAILDNWNTLGGFDIRKNDMPFPSNKMNITKAGVNIKYTLAQVPGLSFTGGGNIILAGRNVGQSFTEYAGIFYIIDFSKNKKQIDNNTK
jgi:hypothetical protein